MSYAYSSGLMEIKDLRKYNASELLVLKSKAKNYGDKNAVALIEDHQAYFQKNVIVTRGLDPPVGTRGEVFWVGRRGNRTILGIEVGRQNKFVLKDNVRKEFII